VADDDDSAPSDDDDVADDDDSAPSDDDDSSASDDDDSSSSDDDDSATETAMVFISEIAEPGSPTSGNAKFVEIFNGGSASVQLDTYTLHRYANGSSSSNSVALSGALGPGSTFVVCSQAAECLTAYGINGDLAAGNVVTGNGDDVYELQESGLVMDTYGQVGVDGTGTNWQYVNTSVVRLPGSAPNLGGAPSTPSTPLDMSEWQLTAWVDALAAGTITPGAHTN